MAEINGTSVGETLNGTSENDVIRGMGGNDTINGFDGDDTLEGGENVDIFNGGAGNDYINGRYGNNDVAIFSGLRANYLIETVTINGLIHARITGIGAAAGDGVDTIVNVEYFQFSDVTVQWGINGNNRPVFGQPGVSDQVILDSAPFTYQVPGTTFIDLDQDDVLTFRATLSSGAALPSWLVFNPMTRTFSGTPPIAAIGVTYDVRVFASDDDLYDPDYEISDNFTITINQAPGADVVGTSGNDVLSGTFRNERLVGGMGDDILRGSAGADIMDGGGSNLPGVDTVDYSASAAAVTLNLATGSCAGGDAEGDFLNQIEGVIGTAFDDSVIGHLGDDLFFGGAGADNLIGNDGSDRLYGEFGDDTLNGGDGFDRLIGGAGLDQLIGGNGDDILFAGWDSANVNLLGPNLARYQLELDTGTEADNLQGGAGDDLLFVGFNDSADGGSNGSFGDALYVSLRGASSGVTVDFRQASIALGSGIVTGFEHVRFVEGSNFDDVLTMRSTTDTFQLATVHGLNGNDQLVAGQATREMYGDNGHDILDANNGSFFLQVLNGGTGDDQFLLNAYSGALRIEGGDGYDALLNKGVTFFSTNVIAVSSIEAISLVDNGHLYVSGAQLANGFASNLAIGGTGSLTVSMTAGVAFVSKLFSFGSNVALTVLGTAGADILKLGNGAHTVDAGNGLDQIKGGSANDTIYGGDGADKINGAGGGDILTGGAGNDVFKYAAAGDSGIWPWSADQITDFEIGVDRLNFVQMDARPELTGDQAFRFVGTGAFSGGAGCIRYSTSGADLRVEVDLDGGGSADMVIILQNRAGGTLTAADFVL